MLLLVCCAGCPRDKAKAFDAGADGATQAIASASAARASVGDASVVDLVSNASGSASWDASAATLDGDEVDGQALRERHRARISADASPVIIVKNGSPADLGERLCRAVVPAKPKDTKILIKPNIGGFETIKDPLKHDGDDGVRGRTTDPEFVRGIVRCLKARGHHEITIAEGYAAKHADWLRLIHVSGYDRVAHEEGVRLVAMDDDGVFDVEGDTPGKPLKVRGMDKTGVPTLLMPKILHEHLRDGLFISAPKIKAHRFGVVSIGIKGMQGTVMLEDAAPHFHQKWRTHKELAAALRLIAKDKEKGEEEYLRSLSVFSERMADLLEVSAPDVVLAEGAPAMGGDGFSHRWPSAEDFAIGGTNPVRVDRVGAAMLGLWDNADLAKELGGHRTSPLIEAAAKRFGIRDLEATKIDGDGRDLLSSGARPVHYVSMSGFSLHSDDSPPEKSPRPPKSARAPVEARALSFASEPKIDGAIDAMWASAPPASFTTDWSGAASNIRTTVRFGWTARALYVLFELESAGLNVDRSRAVTEERAKLYEEDCVELMIAPDPLHRGRYYEIEVGPLGHYLDVAIDRESNPKRPKSDVAWSSASTIGTTVDRDKSRVVIEVAITAPEITSALKRGAVLPLALYRMEGKSPRQYLAWSPTLTERPNFHVPEAFGRLRIE